MKEQLSTSDFSLYFTTLVCLRMNDGRITLYAPSPFIRDGAQQRCEAQLLQILGLPSGGIAWTLDAPEGHVLVDEHAG